MTRIADLEKALTHKVAEFIRDYGFENAPGGQTFYKPTSFGWLAFSLSFIRHKTDFDVTAHAAVRFKQLEDLVQEYESTVLTKEKKNLLASERN